MDGDLTNDDFGSFGMNEAMGDDLFGAGKNIFAPENRLDGPWHELAAECEPRTAVSAAGPSHVVAESSMAVTSEAGQATEATISAENIAQMVQSVTDAANTMTGLINDGYMRICLEEDDQEKARLREELYNSGTVLYHYDKVVQLTDACKFIMDKVDLILKPERQQQQGEVNGPPQVSDLALPQPSRQPGAQEGKGSTGKEWSTQPRRDKSSQGAYVMTLRAKTQEAINPVRVVYEALDKYRVHIASTTMKGRDARIRFYKRREAEMAEEKVNNYVVKGKPTKEWFDVAMTVSSPYSYRTEAFDGQALHRLPFTENAAIDQKKAAQVLYRRNSTWFWAMKDVEVVELHRVPQKDGFKFILEIHVSAEAHARLQKDINTATLDLVSTRLKLHDAVRPSECFRCLQQGHQVKSCKEEPRCKYCTGRHLSIGCELKNETASHKCFNCERLNEELAEQDRVDTNHMATSTRCQFVRNSRSQQRNKNKARGAGRRRDGR